MKVNWRTCRQIGVSAFLLFLAIYYWPTAAKLLGLLFGACLPVMLGGAIAYVINILMSLYERHLVPSKTGKRAKTLRRFVSMAAAIASVVLVMYLVIRLVVPEFLSCVNALIQQAPAAVDQLLKNPSIQKLIPADLGQRLEAMDWQELVGQARQVLISGFAGAASAVSSIFSGVVTTVFSVIFAVNILLGKDTLGRQCRRVMSTYLPPVWYKRVRHALELLNKSFRSYVIGQCTEAVILGGLCVLGMGLFRFPYATMIGTLVGVSALIPIAGAYIGAGVGAFMILSVSAEKAIWFLIFIVVLQQIEGNLIYPKVVGSSIGLPGIFVLAAITIGGAMYGMLGMLLGVPLASTIYQAVREDMARRDRENVPPPDPDGVKG